MYKEGNPASQPLILIIVRAIGEKHPKNLVEFLPTLCDDKLFKPDSMNLRSSIIAGIGAVNQVKGLFEPAHEIMALFVLRKLILQTRICGHPVGQVV